MSKNKSFHKVLLYSFICILLLLPLLIDKPNGNYELMWLLYLLPPILILYNHGYKSGLLTGAFCVLLQLSYELYEYVFYPEEYNLTNLKVIASTALVIAAVTFAMGFLVRYMEEKQKELKKLSQSLEFLANHDSLTSLPNRRAFEQKLTEAILKSTDTGRMFALIFCDLDKFKNLNDTAGHCTGDLILAEIAQRVKQNLRLHDIVARLGGDEFIFFTDDLSSSAEVADLAQKIISTIEKPITLNTIEYKISASLGIALYPRDSTDSSTLLQYADIAMYDSKARGSGNYTFFTPEMGKSLSRQTCIASGLKSALERNEFALVYQPLCNMTTGEITQAEALLRWNHSEMGYIPPSEFIPIAEESGLIVPIGQWVLRKAVQEAKRWHDAGHKLVVSVNISSIQLEKRDCCEFIQHILEETGLQPQYLELEITERVALSNPEEMIRKLNIIRSYGVNLAIDDFGTGYSSLNYLKKYPVRSIKIDRSFVQDAVFEPRDRAMLKALMVMANSLHFSTVAEGVETSEQYTLLEEMECDMIQGYYLSKPLSPVDFLDFIIHRNNEEVQRLSLLR